mmetsp:Transcript_16433/g.27530  ORF Transcript_16433/g.27530 Transcript_16433/m.27530 type:complete len:157 (-) Transcript_16433:100-570(-)
MQFANVNLVQQGHRAIIFDKFSGVKAEVVKEGLHFLVPLVQVPIIIDIRARPTSCKVTVNTKDNRRVTVSLRIITQPQEADLPALYEKLGKDFTQRVIPSLATEAVKKVVPKYSTRDALNKRDNLTKELNDILVERAASFHLVVHGISIINLHFEE